MRNDSVEDGRGDDGGVQLVDEATDVVFRASPDGVLQWVSTSVRTVLGWEPGDIVGQQAIELVHPEDVGILLAARDEVMATGSTRTSPLRIRTASGGYRRMAGRGAESVDETGSRSGRVYALRDVHDDSARLRALTTLSRANGVLVRASHEDELLAEMCRTIVEAGGYALAWFGRALADDARTVSPVAAAGRTSYLEGIRVTWDDSPTGNGPTGVSIRTGVTQVKDSFDDASFRPWQDAAEQHGFRCSISLPVRVEGRVEGALMVYADELAAFDDTAQVLMEDLAADLGYGIARIRDAERLSEALSSSVFVLAAAVESRDPYTAGHQSHVGVLSGEIGRELGLDAERVEGLVLGASIHDLGKISIPHRTLVKAGELTPEEWDALREHPGTGYRITSRFPWPWPIAEMIHQHHERLDGSGYPRGLRGDEILLEARIIAVADLYEAMANDRPYRKAPGHDRATDVLRAGSGVQFDPDVVAAFERVLARGFAFPPQ
jgi:HD-GYP domain-containing protein (c-di-GMP phosphodiesterase class II)